MNLSLFNKYLASIHWVLYKSISLNQGRTEGNYNFVHVTKATHRRLDLVSTSRQTRQLVGSFLLDRACRKSTPSLRKAFNCSNGPPIQLNSLTFRRVRVLTRRVVWVANCHWELHQIWSICSDRCGSVQLTQRTASFLTLLESPIKQSTMKQNSVRCTSDAEA